MLHDACDRHASRQKNSARDASGGRSIALRSRIVPTQAQCLAARAFRPRTSRIGRRRGVEGYCVKCRAKKEIKDAKSITMKNGRPATEGVCPTCGTKIFKIGKGS